MTDPDPDPDAESPADALARLYDVDLLEDPGDLDLYLALARRTGSPILELAVGSGRLAVPLAEAGHRVSGVDLDPAMLARARARATAAGVADRVELIEGDMRSIRLAAAGTFRLAVVGLNSILLAADRAGQRATIATLAAHLGPGGVAVVDAIQPSIDDLARYDQRLFLSWVRTDPATGHVVTKTAAASYEPASRILEMTSIFDEGPPGTAPTRQVRQDRLRLISPDELVDHVEAAGLEVETLAGDLELGPLRPDSDRAVVVARRPG